MFHTLKKKIFLSIKKLKKRLIPLDKPLLAIVLAWYFFGFIIFISASLGLVAKNNSLLSTILTKQAISIFLSLLTMVVCANIALRRWLTFSPKLYIFSLLFTALVFVPGLSFSAGGATRWILVGPISIQPAEIMKVATILFSVYLFAMFSSHIKNLKGLGIFFAVLFIPLAILYNQPDTSTILIIVTGVVTVYFLSGMPWKYAGVLAMLAFIVFTALVITKPYIKERVLVFLNPETDALGSGYQLRQSLIAIGSGGLFGKGFGQGVQKFGYLPEPVGDSIFAVLSEEFGFLGTSFLLTILLFFLLRIFKLAKNSKNTQSALVLMAFGVTLFMQAFINMASMSGLMPLTGLTFPLLSLGGTSMVITGMVLGIVFSAVHASQKARL